MKRFDSSGSALLLVQKVICQGLLCKPVVATGKAGVIRDTEALLDLELTWKLAG
jgi:hypothetical protein